MDITVPCTAADESQCEYHNCLRAQAQSLSIGDLAAYQQATYALAVALQQPEHEAELNAFFELRRVAKERAEATTAKFAKEREAVEASRESDAVKWQRLRGIREREASVQAYNAGLTVLAELREGERIPSSEYMRRVQHLGGCSVEDAQRTFFWLQDAHLLDLDLLYGVGRPTV